MVGNVTITMVWPRSLAVSAPCGKDPFSIPGSGVSWVGIRKHWGRWGRWWGYWGSWGASHVSHSPLYMRHVTGGLDSVWWFYGLCEEWQIQGVGGGGGISAAVGGGGEISAAVSCHISRPLWPFVQIFHTLIELYCLTVVYCCKVQLKYHSSTQTLCQSFKRIHATHDRELSTTWIKMTCLCYHGDPKTWYVQLVVTIRNTFYQIVLTSCTIHMTYIWHMAKLWVNK